MKKTRRGDRPENVKIMACKTDLHGGLSGPALPLDATLCYLNHLVACDCFSDLDCKLHYTIRNILHR